MFTSKLESQPLSCTEDIPMWFGNVAVMLVRKYTCSCSCNDH